MFGFFCSVNISSLSCQCYSPLWKCNNWFCINYIVLFSFNLSVVIVEGELCLLVHACNPCTWRGGRNVRCQRLLNCIRPCIWTEQISQGESMPWKEHRFSGQAGLHSIPPTSTCRVASRTFARIWPLKSCFFILKVAKIIQVHHPLSKIIGARCALKFS